MQITPQQVIDHYGSIIAAIAALGTAAYGVVDATKGFFGGVSNVGFPAVAELINFLFPPAPGKERKYSTKSFDEIRAESAPGDKLEAMGGLSNDSILRTLKSNWINGMASADQRAIAKSLVKLRLDTNDVGHFAAITKVDKTVLAEVVRKMKIGETLKPEEQNTYGRFDLMLTTLLDQAYQRGDQRYRNTAKLLAIPVSVALAIWAGSLLGAQGKDLVTLGILGLIATPLAPVAKDLTSAITAAVKLAEAARGKK